MLAGRTMLRHEIPRVWEIDRSEIVESVYRLEGGRLIAHPQFFDVRGWPPGESEKYTPILEACFDHGGWFYGFFDGDRIIGVVVVDARRMGARGDELQLKFLHVSCAYRKRGLGQKLFSLAADEAVRRGATRLYISATPSRNTIDFYTSLGATPTTEPDPELFALEPEDIHLECPIPTRG
jgi:predicted N-acetyltransferase YhbS